MELLWTPLLLMWACLSEVLGSPPVHILEDHNLLVLTPAGFTQALSDTRFLMVIFREYPALAMKRDACLLILGVTGVP